MVCSWLANSWVCARSVSVTLLCEDSWPCIDASSVLSRIVVTVPIRWPWLVAARRFSASTRVRVAITTSRPSSPESRNSTTAGSRPTLSDAAADRVAADAEQLLRAVVEQRDIALVVHRDHTLADAVQQRFPMIGEAGDLGDLQPAGVPFDPPGQQPRRQQAERGAEPEIEQQPLAGAAEQLPHRRIPLADRGDRQHVAVGGKDRHLADQAVHAVDVDVAEPGPALVGPAGPEIHGRPMRDGSDDTRTAAVGVEDLRQAGARQRDAPDPPRARAPGRRTGRRSDRGRSAWRPCSRRPRSSAGRGPRGTPASTGRPKPPPPRRAPRRRPPAGRPGTGRPGCGSHG